MSEVPFAIMRSSLTLTGPVDAGPGCWRIRVFQRDGELQIESPSGDVLRLERLEAKNMVNLARRFYEEFATA